MLWLIDHGGRLLRVTARLQAHFGTRLPATEFADFLARNLGWICVALSKGGCELRFRPGKVRDAALAVVADKLRRVGARRSWKSISHVKPRWSNAFKASGARLW